MPSFLKKIHAADTLYVQDANGSETNDPNRAETFGTEEEAQEWLKQMYGTSPKMTVVRHPDDENASSPDYVISII